MAEKKYGWTLMFILIFPEFVLMILKTFGKTFCRLTGQTMNGVSPVAFGVNVTPHFRKITSYNSKTWTSFRIWKICCDKWNHEFWFQPKKTWRKTSGHLFETPNWLIQNIPARPPLNKMKTLVGLVKVLTQIPFVCCGMTLKRLFILEKCKDKWAKIPP